MKKVFLFVMLLVSMTAGAQDVRLIDDGFSVSGSMNMYWETEDKNDISYADKGSRWHLERKEGKTTFWIDCPPLNLWQLSKTIWKDAVATVQIMENNLKVYIVRDIQFKHLMVLEFEKDKYMVQLCSIYEPL